MSIFSKLGDDIVDEVFNDELQKEVVDALSLLKVFFILPASE